MKSLIVISTLLIIPFSILANTDSLENIEGLENTKTLLTASIAVGAIGGLLFGGGQYIVNWSDRHYGNADFKPGYSSGNAMIFLSFPVTIAGSTMGIIGFFKYHKYSKRINEKNKAIKSNKNNIILINPDVQQNKQ